MKKGIILCLILSCINLVGCGAKRISTTEEIGTIVIKSVDYTEERETTTYSMVGDVAFPMTTTTSEEYEVTVIHNDHTEVVYGEEAYNYCKDKINSVLQANFYLYEYDDGSYKHEIKTIYIDKTHAYKVHIVKVDV